jgi:PAS domain S-box-containing protein
MSRRIASHREMTVGPIVAASDGPWQGEIEMSLEQITRRPWSGYVAALFLVGIAAGLRMAFVQDLGIQMTYRFFYPAVVAAALLGGLPAALLATGLAALVAKYFWLEPAGSFAIRSHEDRLGLVFFLISCLVLSILSALMRRAQQRAVEAEVRVKAEQALLKSEDLLKSIGRVAKVGGWELDLQTMDMIWTEETYRIHELYPEVCPELDEAIEFYAPEARPVLQEALKRVSEEGIPYDLELPFITAKGNRLWVRAMGNAERKDGKVIRLYGTFQDVTEHKRLQEAQADTIELLRICNGATDKVALIRDLTRIFQQFTGCEAIGVRLRQGDDFPYFETRGFDDDFVRAENSLCARDQYGELIRDYCGHPVLDCMCGNIICGRFDPSKPFFTERGSFWSNCTTELLASTTDADRHARTRNRCNGEGHESVALIPLRSQGETFGLFQFNDRQKGRFTSEKITLLEDLVSYVSIALAKLNSDEERLLTSQRLRLATASGHLGIWDWDIMKDVLVWDERMFELYGVDREEFQGCYEVWEKSLHPDDRALTLDLTRKTLAGECDYDLEFRIILPSGVTRHIKANAIVNRDADGRAVRMIGMNQDITERKQLEEQLFHAQKMESIGQLAGGIAHDFNNILSAIIGYGTLMEMKMGQDDPRRLEADQILAAAGRAADLTRSLLAFSRKQIINPQPLDLNQIIRRTDKFLYRIIGEDIDLKTTLSQEVLTVNVDGGQIEQVLMNLATNSRDAMPTGGTLSIMTDVVEIDADFTHSHGSGGSGLYARLSISDSGTGMNESVRKRLFEPFFTTKEVGKGTGLGLSIVYGIVKQHNGYINVYSEPGEGTTFIIYFPLICSLIKEPAASQDENPVGGTETILVVDDDKMLRELAEKVLNQFGYTVITASNGSEAVDKFNEFMETIELVVMDVIMPSMNGKEAMDRIRKISPSCKVIFISGYTADIIHARGLFDENLEFVSKPFNPLKFLKVVRKVLDQPNCSTDL